MQLETPQWLEGAWDEKEGNGQRQKGKVGGGRAETSLLSVTLLAFDVRGPSCVPLESL